MAEIIKNYSNGSAIKIVYSYTQNVDKNQSTVTMTLYVHRDSYGPSYNSRCNSYMQLDGSTVMSVYRQLQHRHQLGKDWLHREQDRDPQCRRHQNHYPEGIFRFSGPYQQTRRPDGFRQCHPENNPPGQQLHPVCQHGNRRQYQYDSEYLPGFLQLYPYGTVEAGKSQQKYFQCGCFGLLHHPGELAGRHPQ